MHTVIVAVGSTRRPKLDATREALSLLGPHLAENTRFEIASLEVPSGVRHTPLSREEIMDGARHRAEALIRTARENEHPWKYFLGLEGGIDVVRERGVRWVFLENWAYVTDGNGRAAYGQSGAVLLPEPLIRRVVDEGSELGQAIDEYAGRSGVRDAEGAWGVLTNGLITRKDAFRVAILNAFVPLLRDPCGTDGASFTGSPGIASGVTIEEF